MWSTSHHHACRILHLNGLFGREQKQIGHWSWHELDRSSGSEEQSEDFYPAEGCMGGWQASPMCVMETRCLTLVPRSPAFSTGRCLQMLRVYTIDILHWSQRSATPPIDFDVRLSRLSAQVSPYPDNSPCANQEWAIYSLPGSS